MARVARAQHRSKHGLCQQAKGVAPQPGSMGRTWHIPVHAMALQISLFMSPAFFTVPGKCGKRRGHRGPTAAAPAAEHVAAPQPAAAQSRTLHVFRAHKSRSTGTKREGRLQKLVCRHTIACVPAGVRAVPS